MSEQSTLPQGKESNAKLEALKAVKLVKSDLDLHVLLLQKRLGLTKSQANAYAYSEGPAGLSNRLKAH